MLQLNVASIKNQAAEWEATGTLLPKFDLEAMKAETKKAPVWVHVGAGNIFRIFIAQLQQELLNKGLEKSGIIALDTSSANQADLVYRPFDNLTLSATMNADGSVSKEVMAAIAECLHADSSDTAFMDRAREIFTAPSLQMVSFTITEKGYALKDMKGEYLPAVQKDMAEGPGAPKSVMALVTALLYARYQAGRLPLALVSMDNCSHNGERLKGSVVELAKAWVEKGFAEAGFLDYLQDEKTVAFPWSMIDKITPRPHKKVEELLAADGIADMTPIHTANGAVYAPFVNAERPQYLVVEDRFPNGRPALEKAGAYLTDRETVNMTEKMKVTTCLNPLHTAMSVYGCMLGYTLICDEMKDEDIVKLIRRLGYEEGLPVVTDPKILSPRAFLDEVVEQRLPNPFMPDAPQRIATDTSQKVGVRFGETVKSYVTQGRSMDALVSLPLALAGWLRYLLGVDDAGKAFEVSPDPLKEELQAKLSGIRLGEPATYTGQLQEILTNESIFGVNLVEAGLSEKIEYMFVDLLEGPGAVRKTLQKYL